MLRADTLSELFQIIDSVHSPLMVE
jgi:hypothetical protein